MRTSGLEDVAKATQGEERPPGFPARVQGVLRHLPAALVIALISISYSVSYGAMIFGGGSSALLLAGLPLLFVTTCVVMLMQACSSTLPFVVAGADSNSTGILALMVSSIWAGMGDAHADPQAAIATVLMGVALSTVLVGLLLTLLGSARRGNLVQFVPFPVLGGFLAGSGYLLWTGAFGILTGHAVDADFFSALSHLHWVTVVPALIVAVAMLGVPGRKFDHPAVLPLGLCVAALVFYAGMVLSGVSVEEARSAGWMFQSLSLSGFHTPATLSWNLIDWDVLFSHYSEFLTLVAVMTLTILLNATGIGLATRRDVDFNHELRSVGVANVVTGVLGGVVGCHSLSRTLLNYQFGTRNRTASILATFICLVCALFFLPLISYLPKPVLAGLLIGLGAGLLNEWVLKARHRLARGDYSLIVLILAVIAWHGFVAGVALGSVVACVLFVVDYSRVSCVKMEFTGVALHSKLERPMEASAQLKEAGERLFGMCLQGFLFFGSANQMVNRVRQQLQRPRDFIIIDFRYVQGLDASTSQSFSKLCQVCDQHQTMLILTGVSDKIRLPIERAMAGRAALQEFADLDAALEWVENRVLAASAAEHADGDLQVSLKEYFDERELKSLFARMEKVELDAGTLLFSKGEIGDCMYFIEDGQVSISLSLNGGKKVRLRTFANATIVGEMALYSGQKRTADVVTDRHTRAYRLSMARLRQLEREDPSAALQLHNYVVRVLASRLAATNEAYRLTY
jgi:SulP family sulfate permease